MNFFKRSGKKEGKVANNSKTAAKERLHLVLMQDRANVSADFLELMKQEIIEVIKKYIDVDESAIDVRLTNKENADGTNGAPALYANIPILNIKNEARKMESSKKEEEAKEIKKEEKIVEDTKNKTEIKEENNKDEKDDEDVKEKTTKNKEDKKENTENKENERNNNKTEKIEEIKEEKVEDSTTESEKIEEEKVESKEKIKSKNK